MQNVNTDAIEIIEKIKTVALTKLALHNQDAVFCIGDTKNSRQLIEGDLTYILVPAVPSVTDDNDTDSHNCLIIEVDGVDVYGNRYLDDGSYGEAAELKIFGGDWLKQVLGDDVNTEINHFSRPRLAIAA